MPQGLSIRACRLGLLLRAHNCARDKLWARAAAAGRARQVSEDRATAADEARKAADAERSNAAAAFCAHAAALRANAAALGATNYAARAQSLAVATRGEATRETLATELEVALDEIDALRRRAPPPRPAVDRRSVSAPVEAVASLEADLDALRRDVAALGRPRQQASRPTWLLFAAASVALAAWILTPSEDPYAAALTS
jgi:hypothetical protein